MSRLQSSVAGDPLLESWSGPYGGVPPFDRVRVEDFPRAFHRAIDIQRGEIDAIVRGGAATFENTLLALEQSGAEFRRVRTVFSTFTGTMNVGPMRALQSELAPVLAAFHDEIVQNAALFARIEAVYAARETSGLTAEQQRLTTVVYERYVRQGAALGPEQKSRLAQVNQELARLSTTFSQNVLADEETGVLTLEQPDDLDGLPESLRAAAARAAAEHGRPGAWAITNMRSSMAPFLTYASRRDLRERAWRMWIMRGDGGPHDNNGVITQTLRLRAEKAELLGYPTYAHWATSDTMAKTPEAALALMLDVWPAAVARAREEVAAMQAVADAENGGFRIAPWDYRYYAEKVRKATYDLDQDEVKQYLQLENMREAMFWAAGRLYGLEFVPAQDVPVYHSDVRVYEVRRAGAPAGLLYLDPYARGGKSSGAWMNAYRPQARRDGATPIVSNNLNFIEGGAGEPVLISWDDAVTLFHEFGHALHGLISNVAYRSLSGTAVVRDFVEFPSQINEHWLATPEVLDRFARHHETGRPMPAELIAKIEGARTFNEGFKTTEHLGSALYDMRIHLAAQGTDIDPGAFERTLMAEIGMPDEIVMRHRPTNFSHVFAGDGYAAGYYVYLWAETLTADAYEAFVEAGDAYDPEVAQRLRATILSVGNTVPADEAFRSFRGRDVDTSALMRERGFPVTKDT